MPLTEKERMEIVTRHDAGETFAALGPEYGVSKQAASQAAKAASRYITELELDLLKAIRTKKWPVLYIPYGPDYSLHMAWATWVRKRLHDRRLVVKSKIKNQPDGVYITLTEPKYFSAPAFPEGDDN